jgi:hypothetical protein
MSQKVRGGASKILSKKGGSKMYDYTERVSIQNVTAIVLLSITIFLFFGCTVYDAYNAVWEGDPYVPGVTERTYIDMGKGTLYLVDGETISGHFRRHAKTGVVDCIKPARTTPFSDNVARPDEFYGSFPPQSIKYFRSGK